MVAGSLPQSKTIKLIEIKMLYTLSEELKGHKGCARCICVLKDNRIVTGGLDNQIIIWNYVNNVWIQELQLLHHKKYVLSLEPSNTQLNNEYHEINFYSGGIDEIIYRLSAKDGRIFSTYKGHKSAICNIKELSEMNILISGSWDGSARIWDLKSSACKHILNSHQHAVTISIISQPNTSEFFLLTGSQNKSLFLWKIPEARLIKTIPNSHNDIIRSIGISKNIFENETLAAITVSNDCTIKIWQLFLESGSENCILRNTKSHHESFIFDIKFSNIQTERFFTASDDCNVTVWKLENNFEVTLLQNIVLTSAVWNLAEMNGIDSILTVSEDGICRVWMACDTNLELQALSISKKLESIENSKYINYNNSQNNQKNIKLNDIHEINQLDSIIAEKIGTVQIFKDANELKAYEWSNNCWNFLGIITGINNQTRKVNYLGDKYFSYGLYDLVIEVETELNCNYNIIPFNFGDSIIESAEKFCLREGINIKYCKTIIDSIIKSITTVNNNVITAFNELFEPCFEFKLFKKFNIDNLTSSLTKEQKIYLNKFNHQTDINNTQYTLNVEIEHLNDFFLRLKNENCNETSSVTLSQIKSTEMDIIYKKLSIFIGNNSLSIPIIDLWRILALNPQSSDIHKKTDKGWWILALILRTVDSISFDYLNSPLTSENEFRGPLFLICIRFLCNMFQNSTNREVMLYKIHEIISNIDKSTARLTEINFKLSIKQITNKNAILACLAFMFNYIIALNNKNCSSMEPRNLIILYVCKLIPLMKHDDFVKYVNEILHYQLLIFTNNYYHIIKFESYSDVYILEDQDIGIISDFISKYNKISSNSKTLYYHLVKSINIIKNSKNL